MTQTPPPLLFNRQRLASLRARIAKPQGPGSYLNHHFLQQEVAQRLLDKIADINRQFHHIAEIGSGSDGLADALLPQAESFITTDLSLSMLNLAFDHPKRAKLVMDEEGIALPPQSYDLVVSNLILHQTNDLPGVFAQLLRVLKPDGFLIASLLGGQTLLELGQSLMMAEVQLKQGASMHTAPSLDIKDVGSLLQRAGFALPVLDREVITVRYKSLKALLLDLRFMGQGNVLQLHSSYLGKEVLALAETLYFENFGDKDGRIPATFEVLYVSGWSPHQTQQQPCSRGTGQVSLAEIFLPQT